MIDRLRSYWFYGNTYCGIELTSSQTEDVWYAVTAKKSKGEFKNLEYYEASSLSNLKTKVSGHQHAYLSVNNAHVLIKEAPYSGNDQKALSQAFPGLSLSEFYYEVLPSQNRCFVSVCRKDYVDSLLKELEKQKIHILGFHLGFSSLTGLTPFLNEPRIQTARHGVLIGDEGIQGFSQVNSKESRNYQLDDITISNVYLPAAGDLFQYVSETKTAINFASENRALDQQYKQKNFFRKGIAVGIGILLIFLLGNAWAFNSYFSKQQTLQEQVSLLKNQKEAFVAKQQAVEAKEQIVENILNTGSSKSSYYINRIVAQKPGSVRFTEIQFQPLSRSIRPDKKIEMTPEELLVSGESLDNSEFSDWIALMESQSWVDHITVTEYGTAQGSQTGFSIRFLLKNDTAQ